MTIVDEQISCREFPLDKLEANNVFAVSSSFTTLRP